ncbi:MAG: phosphomannomutase/phosphoglucomutase [Patescibacteria group bacterium]|jgi:phosphomannomutase
MIYPQHIFKANDIRGLLHEVTPEIAEAVGKRLVEKNQAKIIVVGRDMRKTSPELAEAIIRGAKSAGATVRDIGMVTTSLFNFAVSSDPSVDAGLMVTASHNPAEWNGIKMAWSNGLPIPGKEMLTWLQEESSPFRGQEGVRENVNSIHEYLAHVLKKSGLAKEKISGAKLVVDFGNGMGALTIRPFLQGLGVSVVELFSEPDASFPNHEANPTKHETLVTLQKRVVEEKADFGVALDGDADRIAFVDNEGIPLPGDLTLALLAESSLQKKKGKIIGAPNQGRAVREAVAAAGGTYIDVPIGRAFLIKAINDEQATLGGEVSGHFMFEEMGNLESVDFALAQILGLWKESGKTFADLVRPLRRFYSSGEVNIEVADKEAILAYLEKTFGAQATSVSRLDGVRAEFGSSWWFIVRPSNTEPLLRITVEAESEALMKEKRDEIVEAAKSVK